LRRKRPRSTVKVKRHPRAHAARGKKVVGVPPTPLGLRPSFLPYSPEECVERELLAVRAEPSRLA
jgi:hypothetical protein